MIMWKGSNSDKVFHIFFILNLVLLEITLKDFLKYIFSDYDQVCLLKRFSQQMNRTLKEKLKVPSSCLYVFVWKISILYVFAQLFEGFKFVRCWFVGHGFVGYWFVVGHMSNYVV